MMTLMPEELLPLFNSSGTISTLLLAWRRTSRPVHSHHQCDGSTACGIERQFRVLLPQLTSPIDIGGHQLCPFTHQRQIRPLPSGTLIPQPTSSTAKLFSQLQHRTSLHHHHHHHRHQSAHCSCSLQRRLPQIHPSEYEHGIERRHSKFERPNDFRVTTLLLR